MEDGGKSADDDSSTLSLLAILGRRGVTIIAIIICASAVIIVAFLVATICLVRRRRHRYHKAGRAAPPPTANGDKYNCRVEALRAIKGSSSTAAAVPADTQVDHSPARSLIQTFDSSPRTPTGRVLLLAGSGTPDAAGNGGVTAARWNSQSCRRQLVPAVNAAPDLVTRTGCADQTLSTFGKSLPPPVSAKRTLSTSDVTSTTPDVKVWL